MLDRVEADGAQAQGVLHGAVEILQPEALQQPQDLHILPPPRLGGARLHQAAQGLERGRQLPSGKRRRLIQRADLLLDQGQIVDRLEDRVLSLIGPGMAGDDLPAATDHHPLDVTAHPDVAMAIGPPAPSSRWSRNGPETAS